MSRFILLAGVAGLFAAGCSSPSEEGDTPDAPTAPPPGFTNQGQGGTGQPVGAAGTGSTLPPPSAGTGGSSTASGGAGGAPVAAGGTGGTAGAGGGSSTIPSGTGNLIMHDSMGWVAGATNGLGIQGSFYPFGDFTTTPPGTTTVALEELAASPTRICISGSASQVLTPAGSLDPAYGQYWGGGVGLNLADAGNMMGPGPWNRAAVTGFSFNVTGTTVPPTGQLRFKVTTVDNGVVNENGYCASATAGPNTFQFGALVNECWAGGAGAPALGATTPIVALQWQVATVTTAATPFDFCIENLTALGG